MMAWSQSSRPALTDQQFVHWQQLVEARTGIDLSQHRSILQSGLNRRLRERGDSDYDAYFELISRRDQGPSEWEALLDCIAVKETSFFRQPAAFDLVRNHLRSRAPAAATLDLWSVGCATGEEAYGLAMMGADAIARSGARCFLGVLATDICSEALRQGRAGRYASRRLDAVPEVLRRRYFTAADTGYSEVVAELRRRVCFSPANLMEIERLPLLAMDVIFCQNVLVYFRRWRTKQIVDALVARLKPGGLLVLGPGEAAQWQHPAMVRTTHQGVSAYLRRIEH